MHHGTPQDMESDPDDEVNVTLHHHTELLLLLSSTLRWLVLLLQSCVCACVWRERRFSALRTLLLPPLSAWPPLRMAGGVGRGCQSFKSAGGLFTCLSSSSQVQWSRLPPQLVFHHCLPSHDMLNRMITFPP